MGLTAVFEMGTGVTPLQEPPELCVLCLRLSAKGGSAFGGNFCVQYGNRCGPLGSGTKTENSFPPEAGEEFTFRYDVKKTYESIRNAKRSNGFETNFG